MDEQFVIKLLPIVQALRAYHRHEVLGLENFDYDGGVLVATNHSLATYDIALLMAVYYEYTGRFPRSLIDRLFYKIPLLGDLMQKTGSVMGTKENAVSLLQNGEVIFVAPGGMRESLRPSAERYQIRWDNRTGFARLAIETQCPVILSACPKADDIFDVYENRVTAFFYKTFKIPVFMARGFGLSPIPKPVKLRHFVSKPIFPPKPAKDEAGRRRQLKRFHMKLVRHMNDLIAQGVAYRKGPKGMLPGR